LKVLLRNVDPSNNVITCTILGSTHHGNMV
jgi:hypothetical protein